MAKRILIVEDAKDLAELFKELLQGEGYITEIAENGIVALEILRNAPLLPDLILLDYMMPHMNGPAFRREQQKDARFAAIPVLLMTAVADSDGKIAELGALDVIKKPIDIDRLLATIKNCLDNSPAASDCIGGL